MGLQKRLLLLELIVLIFMISAVVQAAPGEAESKFWTDLSELKPGMKGTGKTVIAGTEIVEFEVEILAVLRDQGPIGDLILVRVSGPPIEEAGGIAAGMSGSPVYVEGKLLGAIGYGFALTDHRVGMVTPIEDMLPVLKLAVVEAGSSPLVSSRFPEWEYEFSKSGPVVDGQRVRWLILISDPARANRLAKTEGSLVMVPAATPLLVSGFGRRAFRFLSEKLEPFGLVPVEGAGTGGTEEEPLPFEPGSPFGLQLVRGDVNVTALGTVTYKDEKGFIGFGHPFMNRGRSNFFATTARIFTTVPQQEMPFKLGAPGEVVGTINQDRFAAVGGSFGDYPRAFPLSVMVRDKDLVQLYEARMEVIQDPVLTVNLAASAALQALDRGIDRIGPGTSRVVFRIEADGLPTPIVRDNMFYSDRDISAVSLAEFMEAMDLLIDNEFKTLELTRVDMDIQLQEKRLTATIEEVVPQRTEVLPGESVNVEVEIRPFRGQPITKIVRLDIPEDVQSGNVRVTVRGGGYGLFPEEVLLHERSGEDGTDQDEGEDFQSTTAQNLDKLVADFTSREKNNDLVVEFYPFSGYQGEVAVVGEEAAQSEPQAGGEEPDSGGDGAVPVEGTAPAVPAPEPPGTESPQSVKAVLSTGYVINGVSGFDLTILMPPAPEQNGENSGQKAESEVPEAASEAVKKKNGDS